MTTDSGMADLAYAQAETCLVSYADDTVLADGVATVDDCRRAYEAAGAVWPSIIHDL